MVTPSWWPGLPFLVTRTEEERQTLIEEGEPPGQVWTLAETRRLAGLRPGEKLDAARVKEMFSGEVAEASLRPTRGGRP